MQAGMQQRDTYVDVWANNRSVHAVAGLYISHLEEELASARPRLLMQARRRGITPGAVEDIVQETLIEAWQHLDTLRTPERFHAWLDGICRNICLRWQEKQQRGNQHLTSLPDPSTDSMTDDGQTGGDIPDPLIADPLESLNHQDLCTLLDHLLQYLSDEARQLVELAYLEEIPQPVIALRLGITLNVLEARLHRARKRLRQVLNTDMRSEALAFGLALDEQTRDTWRPAREWCWYCGRHRLEGTFEPLAGDLITFRMRCPACDNLVNTGGRPIMDGLHSFRPALKRLWRTLHVLSSDLEHGISFCPMCEEQRPARILHPDELAAEYPTMDRPNTGRSALVIDCPNCQVHVETVIDSCFVQLPIVQRFMEDHPRYVIGPQTFLEHNGQRAIYLNITDFTSAAQLTLLVHHRTLRVLAVYQA